MTLEVFSKSGTTSFPADAFENSETNHRKQSGYDRENSQGQNLVTKFSLKIEFHFTEIMFLTRSYALSASRQFSNNS